LRNSTALVSRELIAAHVVHPDGYSSKPTRPLAWILTGRGSGSSVDATLPHCTRPRELRRYSADPDRGSRATSLRAFRRRPTPSATLRAAMLPVAHWPPSVGLSPPARRTTSPVRPARLPILQRQARACRAHRGWPASPSSPREILSRDDRIRVDPRAAAMSTSVPAREALPGGPTSTRPPDARVDERLHDRRVPVVDLNSSATPCSARQPRVRQIRDR